ncbi:MAG: hypothetical protein WCD83_13130, partial [Pseudolabrys sp.]
MNTKPILLWPKPRSDVQRHLDRAADYFLVVDTNSAYELQKLYKLRREMPIFDPFPTTESIIEILLITLLRVIAVTTSSGSKLVRKCCERCKTHHWS